jgi:hypothetical protein
MSNTNNYQIAFPFKNQYEYTSFNANELANIVLEDIVGDAMSDMCSEYNQWFCHEFKRGDKRYRATFSVGDTTTISVYEIFGSVENNNDEEIDYACDEILVEKDIPYIVLRVDNGEDRLLEISNLI